MDRQARRLTVLGLAVALLVGVMSAPTSAALTGWETIAVARTWGGVSVVAGDATVEAAPGVENGYPLQYEPYGVIELTSRTLDDPRRVRAVLDTTVAGGPVWVEGSVAAVCWRPGGHDILVEFLEGVELPSKTLVYNKKYDGACDSIVITVRAEAGNYPWDYELRARIQVRYAD